MSSEPTSPDSIMKLGTAFFASKTLLSAIELDLFTELARRNQDAEELQKTLGIHPRAARDFFDALVAMGMLVREQGVYRNTPETDLFLDRNKPSYIGGILQMANERLYRFWGALTTGLRTGKPQNEAAEGGDLFETLYADPKRLKLFLEAMSGISLGAASAIARKFPWKEHKTFIDIGCAQGCLPVQVARQNLHLTGGGFDLPAVEPIFNEYVQKAGMADSLRFYPGDFFAEPLPAADVFVMGHILHDWNLDEKKILIRKAYDSLPDDGALIVYESLIDDNRRENAAGLLMSLNMLIETAGGFDYTGADCQRWMHEAGFRTTRVEHLAGPESMVVGIK